MPYLAPSYPKDFLSGNFINYECYKNIKPDSNQLACFYVKVKIQKSKNLEAITVANAKFPLVIDKTRTFTCNAVKAISDYLSLLKNDEYFIEDDEQKFPNILSLVPHLHNNEEVGSYDIESLFTNISREKPINYIVKKFYVHKKLTLIRSKLSFIRLLIKLPTT